MKDGIFYLKNNKRWNLHDFVLRPVPVATPGRTPRPPNPADIRNTFNTI